MTRNRGSRRLAPMRSAASVTDQRHHDSWLGTVSPWLACAFLLALTCAACTEPQASPAQGVALLAGAALLDATEIHFSPSRDGQPYHLLRQADGSFRMLAPIRDTAEPEMLANIAAGLHRCTFIVVDAPPPVNLTGLDSPSASLTARFGERTTQIEIGKLTDASTKRLWARVDGRVGQVPSEALTCLQVEQERLRARAMFASFAYTRIEITTATGTAELQRDITRDVWTWQAAGDKARPDAVEVIAALRALSIESFRYGTDVDRGTPTARFLLESADSKHELKVWALPDGRCIAKQPHRDVEVFVAWPAVLRATLR